MPVFPDPQASDSKGLLAVGGDLSPDRLVTAYRQGIFPWYSQGDPILWWSPLQRMVLYTNDIYLPKSLIKRIKKREYTITLDRAFEQVMVQCQRVHRPKQDGTWITDEMIAGYVQLAELGYAHSCEAWLGDQLVGGLYGVSIGRAFSGESMFARASDASKVALTYLGCQLARWGYPIIDCQLYTDHLSRFGAYEIPRAQYLAELKQLVDQPTKLGPWRFDKGFFPLD